LPAGIEVQTMLWLELIGTRKNGLGPVAIQIAINLPRKADRRYHWESKRRIWNKLEGIESLFDKSQQAFLFVWEILVGIET